ncbi:MAG: amidohydrolase family protein [Candidatus Limnocylindrales bacterium]
MRVDIHAHAFPGGYLDLLVDAGLKGATFIRALEAGDEPGQLDRRLQAMDDAGVDLQVLSPSSLTPALEDAAASAIAARLLNERYAEIVRQHQDRFASFAVVPLPHLDAALAGLDDAFGRPGVVGLAVTTTIGGVPLGDARFEPLLAELDRRGTLLFIHPAGEAAGSTLIEGLGLSWPLGAPIEDTVCVSHLIARGIPFRFPNLRIVNAHLGGALPMVLQRLENQFSRIAPDAPEPPSVASRRMWYDTVGHGHAPALVAAQMSFGADRLVLGTDYPYVRGEHHRAAVDYIAAAGFSAAEVTAIRDAQAAALITGGRG